MTDNAGFLIAAYVITFVVLAAYLVSLRVRSRS